MTTPSLQMMLMLEQRSTKKQLIEEFFTTNLGTKFSSYMLHERFGSAFRTRVSEINKSVSPIEIKNEVRAGDQSYYWAEKRTQ